MAAPSQGSLRRRLQSSQEAQHRQALVVRKLQAKVLQYRTRCRELEQQVEAAGGSLPGRREATEDQSLEKALLRLEEEQQRCENLAEVNALLREQLDEAGEVNSALKEDVAKLTADWMRAREELGLKESERRREREVYDSYVRGEHQRLLSLWCQVVTFRRQFLEMKAATDRDLSELKAEHMRLSGAVLVSCSRPTSGDLEKKELQDRVLELSALLVPSQKKNEEKEKPMETPDDTVEILEAGRLEKEREVLWSKSAKEENLSLQKLIKDITEALQEELSARQDSIDSLLQQHRQQEEKCRTLQQRLEQLQEECATSSSQRQHLQSLVQALRSDCANLERTRDELQQQLEVTEQEASCLRQRNTELQLKEDSAQGDKVEQQEAMERGRHEQELLLKDFAALEGKHSLLQSELVVARETLEESQLQRDLLEREKHELTMALEKAEQSVAELTRTQKQLSVEIADLRAAAANMSSINEALEVEKVQLNHLVLQVSRVAKALASCLSPAAAASQPSCLPAVGLAGCANVVPCPLERENEVVSEKVAGLERARVCEQERLSWCERTKAELCAEKAQLEQLLQEAEEQQEGLRVQLRRLAEEKEETREQLSEVSRQQESASTGLEQLRQESSRQGLALAKVSEEKEVLVQEKAALELRLAAVERDRQGLSEQLAEARPVKETLARSLFEAQQRVSQLEIARSHLEMRLHTVTQAKDVIQGEVKCLQRELEAERSLLRQERENAAQQLLRRERQHDDALRLRQSDHEAETQRLLQDLQAAAEGEQLSWLSEKRRLSQRLECLQGAVARLELEKTELKQYNAELRRTLEQVERERRRLKRCCRGRSLPDACALSLSDQRKVPASRQVALLETQLVQEPK
ncbi:centrosome-associated protein CEP250-like [Patagioenas fasciata]|uniref:centrosome-associated protein CEP250-like n=1 Tax=Patagioenas fasciata TaxID=372321 RepID=UPI003A9A19EC